MSKIQDELVKATGCEPGAKEDRQEFLRRLVTAVGGLSDAKWDALSDPAADWYNGAADAKNAKKDVLPEMPDYQPPAAEEGTRRRRRSADDDEPAAYEPKVGATVELETKRGAIKIGKIVELDSKEIVLEIDNDEVVFDRDRVASIKPVGGATASGNDEPDGPAEVAVGVRVKIETARGKIIEGEVTELTDDDIVIKDDKGEPFDFARDRLKSCLVIGGGKPAAAPAPAEEGGRRRRGGSDAPAPAPAAAPAEGRTRASNGSVSIGTRIRELIADDMKASVEDIAKALKKEGLDFKENTLDLNYKEAHKFLDILRDKKLLK